MDEPTKKILSKEIKDLFLDKILPTFRAQVVVRALEMGADTSDETISSVANQTIEDVLLDYVLNNNRPEKPWKCVLGLHDDWKYLEPRDDNITWRVCLGCFGRQRGRRYNDETWWDWA